jgi:hypothetical protein
LSFLALEFARARADGKTDVARKGLVGPVKRVVIPDSDGRAVAAERYDSRGNLVESWEYNTSGSPSIKDVYSYDARGRLRESAHFSYSGSREWLGAKEVRNYDLRGRRAEAIRYEAQRDGSMRLAQKMIFYFDQGRLIHTEYYDRMGRQESSSRYLYGLGGRLERIERYDATGSLRGRTFHKYEARGRLAQVEEYDTNGSFGGKTVYRYTAQGITVEQHGAQGQVAVLARYDRRGNLVERFHSPDLRDSFTYVAFDCWGNWTERKIVSSAYGERAGHFAPSNTGCLWTTCSKCERPRSYRRREPRTIARQTR